MTATAAAKSMRKTKRRKPVTISRDEAVRRIRAILVAIQRDTEVASATEAALEAGNAVVMASQDRKFPGARTYDAVRGALTFTLAMTLARLFDEGAQRFSLNKRDIASIPLLLRLMRQKRCLDALAREARAWTPLLPDMEDGHEVACRRACARAVDALRTVSRDRDARDGMKRLRDMRNKEMAHTMMFPATRDRALYRQLFRLTEVARDVVEAAALCVEGRHYDSADVARIRLDDGRRFWEHSLRKPDPGPP